MVPAPSLAFLAAGGLVAGAILLIAASPLIERMLGGADAPISLQRAARECSRHLPEVRHPAGVRIGVSIIDSPSSPGRIILRVCGSWSGGPMRGFAAFVHDAPPTMRMVSGVYGPQARAAADHWIRMNQTTRSEP